MRCLNIYVCLCVVIDAAFLIFSLVYFIFKTRQSYVIYVSDLLNEYKEYKIVMALLGFLQMFIVLVYAFMRRHSHLAELWGVCLGVGVSVAGWCIVLFGDIPKRTDGESFSVLHFVGACLYVGGNLFYIAFLLRDCWKRYDANRTLLHLLLLAAMCTFIAGCATFGILFIVFARRNWIYQHMLFTCFLAAHLSFFINAIETQGDSKEYANEFNLFTYTRILDS